MTKHHPAHAKRRVPVRRVALASLLAVSLSCAAVVVGVQTVLASDEPAIASPLEVPAENATQRSEVVYGTLSATGSVEGVYVVNVLEPDAPGMTVDFGSYDTVSNLTDASGIVLDGDAVIADVAGDSFSYQGNLGSAALPWSIDVHYALDGVEVDPEDLAGASGSLEVRIATKRNDAVDPTYYDNYLLQISVTLPGDVARNVATAGGQIARAGSDMQVTFMGMPGEDGAFSLTADVRDFHMSGITIAAVPLSFAIDLGDTSEFTSGFQQLADGVGQLSDGASQLSSGAATLADGIGQLTDGASGIAEGARGLASGVDQMTSGLAGVASGLILYQEGLAGQAQQAQAAADACGTDDDLAAGLQSALTQYTMAYTAAYEAARAVGAEPAEAAMQAAQDANVLAAAGGIQSAVEAVGAKAGYAGAAEALAGAAAGLGSADDQASILGGASALAQGSAALSSGASELASGADSFAAGGSATASGASDLASGASELSSGVDTLYVEVQGMPEEVEARIDEMIASYDKSDYVPVSFASSKNVNVDLVQFVISTAAIELPEQETEEAEETEPSIIDRFLDLFR